MRPLLPLAVLVSLPLLAGAQSVPDTTAAPAAPMALGAALSDTTALLSLPPDTVVAAAPDTTLAALQSLSEVERRARGRADATRHYRPARGVFWSGVGIGLTSPVLLAPVLGPLGAVGGLGGALTLGLAGPRQEKLLATAPHPELLRDASYRNGYKLRASNRKLGQAVVGWGVGTLVALGTLIVTLAVLFSGGFS